MKKTGKHPSQKGQAFTEFAIVIPIMVLMFLAIITFSAGFIAYANAANAANYGARRGSVAQENAIGMAMAAAQSKANQLGGGSFSAIAYGGGGRGSQIIVEVHWETQNLLNTIGIGPAMISGTATSAFRQEGW
ncbi:MAG: pilus assembly protein [Anaerolineaceae bacterium]|nr:pilus assembly protein [Anaerolineaceae bacterium]